MGRNLFLLNDEQWQRMERLLPKEGRACRRAASCQVITISACHADLPPPMGSNFENRRSQRLFASCNFHPARLGLDLSRSLR